MIEVGDREIRNVQVSDLTASYLQLALGKEVELLLGAGNTPTSKRLLAIKYEGKIRKESLRGPILAIVLSTVLLVLSLLLWGLLGWFGILITVALAIATIAALKNFFGLLRFS